jgi:hypothetical protein
MKDNPWMRRPAYLAVFFWMIMEAEHGKIKDGDKWRDKEEEELRIIIFNGQKRRLLPGQFTAGLNQLSDWTGVPRGTVGRIIKCFENETMIETEKSNKFTLYTIKNWNEYQMNETQNETTMRNKRNSNETPMRTPKECNNVKNEKNIIIMRPETESLYDWIDKKCSELGLENSVNKKALNIFVEKYIGKIQLRVELEHYMAWMIGDGKRVLSTARVGNCFKRQHGYNKAQELKNLEWKQAPKDPYIAQKAKAAGVKVVAEEIFSIDPAVKAKLFSSQSNNA